VTKRYAHTDHDVNWTLRSLMAAGLLSVCVVASVISATASQNHAASEQRTQLAIAEQAQMVTELANYLAAQTAAVRNALDAPRLKPAKATSAVMLAGDVQPTLAKFDLTSLTVAKLNGEERTCLAQAIYYEARSEPRVGQLAVADVVLNRVASSLYPNSICGVVYQGSKRRTGCQFSFTCDGSMQARLSKRKWQSSDNLAVAVLSGMRAPVSRNATHYHANYVTPYWAASLTPTAPSGRTSSINSQAAAPLLRPPRLCSSIYSAKKQKY